MRSIADWLRESRATISPGGNEVESLLRADDSVAVPVLAAASRRNRDDAATRQKREGERAGRAEAVAHEVDGDGRDAVGRQ